MTKHIFVTGGVASSLGKGLTASSLGRLLKARGLRVCAVDAAGNESCRAVPVSG